MGLKEKIRMLGIVIVTLGLFCIPIGLAFSTDQVSIITNLTNSSSIGGLGVYFSLFGTMLITMSFILPRTWIKN